MATLIATSVVRGSQQGESHGGVYLIETERKTFRQMIDWNTPDIDWQGRGWDRGLRGIAIDGERVVMAASNELFVYDPDFHLLASYQNPYLMHAHELAVRERCLYIASTGFDAILGFDLDTHRFCSGVHLRRIGGAFQARLFNPLEDRGPKPGNELHINNVFCSDGNLYISGLRTACLLQYDGRKATRRASLPRGVHNARPFRAGVLYNHTDMNQLCWERPDQRISLSVPLVDSTTLTHTDLDTQRLARAGFGRGLCPLDDHSIATGFSPSSIAVHDLNKTLTHTVVTLSHDVRNAIHGLALWPF